MDYAEALVEMNLAIKEYRKAVLKNNIEVARTHAEIIHELSVVLVQATETLWRDYEKRIANQV